MRIKDIPQTGKLGLTVTFPGRNGLIRRTAATPRNPRSGADACHCALHLHFNLHRSTESVT